MPVTIHRPVVATPDHAQYSHEEKDAYFLPCRHMKSWIPGRQERVYSTHATSAAQVNNMQHNVV